MPRSASSCGTLIRGPRIVYPPRLSSDRGSPVYPSLFLGLVRSFDDVKPCLGTYVPKHGFTSSNDLTKPKKSEGYTGLPLSEESLGG